MRFGDFFVVFGRLRDQTNEFASCENFVETLLPKKVTALIATMAMKATRIPYSARAAPSSSVKNFLALSNGMFMAASVKRLVFFSKILIREQ